MAVVRTVTQRYDAVAHVRRHVEKKVAAALAAAKSEVDRLRAERDALVVTPQETASHSAAEAVLAHLAHERAENARRALDEKVGNAQTVAGEQEQKLIAAHQGVRLVELLQDRARVRLRREIERREEKALEEASRRR